MEIVNFIPEFKLEDLDKRIISLNKRAIKLGLKPFIFKETKNFEDREINFYYDNVKQKSLVRFIEVSIEGEEIKLNGWRFIAGIDHDIKYNIVNKLVNIELDKDYSKVPANCDHCNHNRSRKKTYLVQNEASGKLLQVGSTCVKDFTGNGDAEKILNLYTSFQTCFETIQGDCEKYSQEAFRYQTERYVQIAITEIKKYGFTPKSKADFIDSFPTSEIVNSQYFKKFKATDNVKELSSYILNDYVKFLESTEYLDEFQTNILNFLRDSSFKFRYGSYITAAVSLALRKKDKDCEKQNSPKQNSFVGKPKEKLTKNLTVVSSSGFQSQFGYGTRYGFRDAEGNYFVWFSSSSLDLDDNKNYDLKFKIKQHSTWKDQKQNIITHVKLA